MQRTGTSSGEVYYELSDHLGNVRLVFSKNITGQPAIEGSSDYYPGGMAMPGRNIVGDYRYNYQGQELDDETGKVAFQLRLYDQRINRWLSPDPYGQHASPYMSMGNNWISRVDPDGGMDCPDPPCNNDVSAAILLDEVVVSAPRMNNSWNTEGMYWNTTFQGNLNDWNNLRGTNFTNPRDAFDWLLAILLSIALRSTFNKKVWFRRNKDYLLLKLPYVGTFISAVYLAQFTQAVALLTASKLPVLNSIQLVKKMINFLPLQEALTKVEEKVLAGRSLNESMKGTKIFDNKMISLVKVAEETNQTKFIFERLNQQYAIEVQQKSKMLSTLMEPLIIVVVGIFVGVILVSLYLPMFKLSSVLG